MNRQMFRHLDLGERYGGEAYQFQRLLYDDDLIAGAIEDYSNGHIDRQELVDTLTDCGVTPENAERKRLALDVAPMVKRA